MSQTDKPRLYSFDNLKCILIFLVVFGHLLEIAKGWENDELRLNLYRLIYSFHMPVFMFMLEELPMEEIEYQFTTPYWLLWYLFSIICYHLLIPLLDVDGGWRQILVLVVCFLLALLSGNDKTVGYYFSLGRIITFLPFFMMGYYGQKWKAPILAFHNKFVMGLLFVAVGLMSYYVMEICDIPNVAFYGSLSYERLKIDFVDRWVILSMGMLGVLFFVFALAPLLNRKIPIISTIGRNSISIFLMHGFIIKLMDKEEMGELLTPGYCVVIALLIIVLLGNGAVGKLFRWICTGWWLEKIYDLLKERESN